jgi:DNA topoisomerase IB
MVTRHVWQDALDEVTAFTKTSQGRKLYAWRKETIERSFAEAKENHGLRFARMLGLANMREQSFLTAAVQNMKRLARAFFFSLFSLLPALIQTATPRFLRKVAVC